MTSKNTPQKRKTGIAGLILMSLLLSFLILYIAAVCLWVIYGYKTAISFFLNLLKANQVGLTNLHDTILSHPYLMGFSQKMTIVWQDSHLANKTQALTQNGANSIKEWLSGLLSDELVSDALSKGFYSLQNAYIFTLKAGFLLLIILKIFLIKSFLLVAAIPLFGLALRNLRPDAKIIKTSDNQRQKPRKYVLQELYR